MFDQARLLKLCPDGSAMITSNIAGSLNSYGPTYGVTTNKRAAFFIAQVAYESARFTRMMETLSYTAARIAEVWPRLAARAAQLERNPEALGNAVYAGRLGNGDEASGDGFKYRGRGLIQLTGRDNYRAQGLAINVDLINEPDRAAAPPIAAEVALHFWQSRGCNAAADAGDISAVTRLINGPALEGLDARTKLTQMAMTIWSPAADLIA